jgi:uncharacterized membrane protein
MDADQPERERALEARIAQLEARLRRLEGHAGLGPDPSQAATARPQAATTPPEPQPTPPPAPFPPPPPPVQAPWPASAPQQTLSGWVLPKSARTPPTPPTPAAVAASAMSAVAATPALADTWATPTPATTATQPQSGGFDLPSFDDLEARLTGRALAWVGGLALVLGAIFFLSLAFSRGWIGPELRVLIGLVAGSIALAAGAAFMERDSRLLGHVLTPVGLAIISISLVAGTRLYGLIPVELGLAVALLSAVAAAAIAIRADSPIVASFGLIAVLVAPPLLDAPADMKTLAFVGVVLVGTTAVALWRSWRWLPPVAFVLAAPQAATWIWSDPEPATAMIGLGLFWLLNTVAAGGEEFRRHRDDLSTTSATLLLANAVFLVWAGFTVLDGDLEAYRGSFLVIGAFAHLAIGVWFVLRDGERNLFGLLTIGSGIALLTMAAPAQLGAPAVPVAWTAEAVALAWLAVRRAHPYGAMASAVLYGLAGAALIDLFLPAKVARDVLPFTDGDGAALGFFLLGIAAGVWIVRDRSLRSGLAAYGLLVAAVCAAARLDDPSLVIALSVLMVVGVGVHRLLPRLPQAPIAWQLDGLISPDIQTSEWRPVADEFLFVASLLVGALAAAVLVQVDGLPFRSTPTGPPFLDPTGAAALTLAVATALAGLLHGDALIRRAGILGSTVVLAYALTFEFDPWLVTILWVAIGAGLTLLTRVDREGRLTFLGSDIAFIGGAAIVALAIVARPTRLVVGSDAIEPIVALRSAAALAAICIGLVWLARSARDLPWARWSWLAAGVGLVYLLSVGVVDAVATQVGGHIPTDELRTWGQVALSVLWSSLGVIAFVAGLRLRLALLRQAGLVLLALATAKVFLIDLSALDVAYRVITLIALGLLLLVSAGLWQRLQPNAANAASRGAGPGTGDRPA